MPLRQNNTRTFHRTTFAGQLETIMLLKRGDDQQQGTVTTYKLFDCRRSRILSIGEQIQGDMTADHRTIWHIPRQQLDKNGIAYINSADRIVDMKGRYWQKEATTEQDVKLFENHLDLQCLRVDPPGTMVAPSC